MPATSWSIEQQIRAPSVTLQVRSRLCDADEEVDSDPDHNLTLGLTSLGRSRLAYRQGSGGSLTRFMDLGPLLFIPARHAAHGLGEHGFRRVVTLRFSDEALARTLGGPPDRAPFDWNRRRLEACASIRGTGIPASLQRLAREAAEPGFASEYLVEGLGNAALVELARHLIATAPAQPRAGAGLAPWQLRRIDECILSHPALSPGMAEVAAACGISPRHLARAFRHSTGETLGSHVERLRTSRAKELLQDRGLAVKEIAARLGFSHVSSFSAAFTRATGESPSRFRRHLN